MGRDEQIGRLLLEASTGMHGEEAKILSDAWCDMARNNEELQACITELEKDSARYRWLREQPDDCSVPRIDICYWTCENGDSVNTGEGLRLEAADKAIDTAMQKD